MTEEGADERGAERRDEEQAASEPLGEVAEAVASRRDADDGESDVFEEAFEDVDLEVDSEAVWERLAAEETDDSTAPVGDEERVVDKRSFCHRCEYFSEPPALECSHEGTEIVELVDVANFRVRGCPVVAERDRLEGFD
jgi:hypothetical protein